MLNLDVRRNVNFNLQFNFATILNIISLLLGMRNMMKYGEYNDYYYIVIVV